MEYPEKILMPSNLFLYIVLNLILLQVLSLELSIIETIINAICILGISTLGIAHGAIDDILYGSKEGKPRFLFIVKYVITIICFGLCWLLIPDLAFIIFLCVSAFHFGQTQLNELKISPKLIANCIFFLWGAFVILIMLAINKESLSMVSFDLISLPVTYYHIIDNAQIYLIFDSFLLFFFFVIFTLNRKISLSSVLIEIFLLVFIACSFSIIEPFVAFSLFFILIHSMQAIHQEFEFCKSQKIIQDSIQFFLLFIPLTMCSLVFVGGVLFALSFFDYGSLSPFVLLVLLSSVTIPHCFVMDKFYDIENIR